MDLSRLKKIFDIQISGSFDITLVNIDRDDKTVIEDKTVMVNVPELDEGEREEVMEVASEQFEEEGRVLRDDEYREANDLEQTWSERSQETVDFFDGIINSRYVRIIEDSLYLRNIIENRDLKKEQIDKRKNDLGERHGVDAPYISNLCTAEYFDNGGAFRTLYLDKFRDGSRKMHKYNEEFQKIIEGRFICTFVETEQTVYEVTQEVRGTLAKYQREEPVNDFIDIRGIGFQARDIIDDVVANLEDEFFAFDAQQWGGVDDYVIRIDPNGLPSLGSSYK